jgi:hypothetical protein
VPNIFWETAAEKLLHGKIRVDSAYISGINVLNLIGKKQESQSGTKRFFYFGKSQILSFIK